MNIIDIANLCGVSKSTVSRYLTGGSISQKTADKIAKAIEETGFEHNVAAVQLKTNKSGLVGVIVDGLDSQSVTRILAGMSETCLDRGYQPSWHSTTPVGTVNPKSSSAFPAKE